MSFLDELYATEIAEAEKAITVLIRLCAFCDMGVAHNLVPSYEKNHALSIISHLDVASKGSKNFAKEFAQILVYIRGYDGHARKQGEVNRAEAEKNGGI